MKESEIMNTKKNLFLKIVVSILVVLLIAAIWIVKNKKSIDTNGSSTVSTSAATDETNTIETTAVTTAIDSTQKQIGNNNPDFALNYTDETDLEKLKSYGLPIIIDFGADWCGPCQELAPIIDDLNQELRGKAIIKFVNSDSNLGIISNYDFQYIPMQIFIDSEGKPYNHSSSDEWESKYDPNTNELLYTMHTGALPKDEFLSILKEMGMQ